jgi:glycosyltransferase involved in cell wall biosynthesis
LQVFPNLPQAERVSPRRRAAVCIVTPDIAGPIRGGGIGTAYRHLALALASDGHDVTILYTLGEASVDGPISKWIAHYAALGIVFIPLPPSHPPVTRGTLGSAVTEAVAVYDWLKLQKFDIVHGPEWRGHLYYALRAKQAGIGFHDVNFCIGTHSPTLWNELGNRILPNQVRTLILSYMERLCVELADTVISPSQYMLQWMLLHHYALPEGRCFVQPNVMDPVRRPTRQPKPRLSPKEFVFFGRLDPRKGLIVFCEAVAGLFASRQDFRITFLGGPSDQFDSGRHLKSVFGHPPIEYRWISDLSSEDALDYLGHPDRLAVIASLIDNSPSTVLECLSRGIAFIAAQTGGIPELIDVEDLEEASFFPHPRRLRKKLLDVLERGAIAPRARVDPEASKQAWLGWHGAPTSRVAKAPRPAAGRPLVSVCIAHYNRPSELLQAVGSLERQTYPDVEIIVVDDGSDDPEALRVLDELSRQPPRKGRSLKVLIQENKYPGAARNFGISHAAGALLLFMDDDNVAEPHELETLVGALNHADADAATCFRTSFRHGEYPREGDELECFVALGACASAGLFLNCFGDTNTLIRRETFEAIGGFREEYGVGKEDWEFLARLTVAGHRLVVVPERLFWYRHSDARIGHQHLDNLKNVRRFAGEILVAEPYADHFAEISDLIYFAQGMEIQQRDAAALYNRVRRNGDKLANAARRLRRLTDAGTILPGRDADARK